MTWTKFKELAQKAPSNTPTRLVYDGVIKYVENISQQIADSKAGKLKAEDISVDSLAYDAFERQTKKAPDGSPMAEIYAGAMKHVNKLKTELSNIKAKAKPAATTAETKTAKAKEKAAASS